MQSREYCGGTLLVHEQIKGQTCKFIQPFANYCSNQYYIKDAMTVGQLSIHKTTFGQESTGGTLLVHEQVKGQACKFIQPFANYCSNQYYVKNAKTVGQLSIHNTTCSQESTGVLCQCMSKLKARLVSLFSHLQSIFLTSIT